MIRRHRHVPAVATRPRTTHTHTNRRFYQRMQRAGPLGWCMAHSDEDVPATHVADWTDPEDGETYRRVRLCDECGEVEDCESEGEGL